jgi:hypothetical protein
MQIWDGKKAVFQSGIRGSEKYFRIMMAYFKVLQVYCRSSEKVCLWGVPNKKARKSGLLW